jgi:hypothetical protein
MLTDNRTYLSSKSKLDPLIWETKSNKETTTGGVRDKTISIMKDRLSYLEGGGGLLHKELKEWKEKIDSIKNNLEKHVQENYPFTSWLRNLINKFVLKRIFRRVDLLLDKSDKLMKKWNTLVSNCKSSQSYSSTEFLLPLACAK